MDSRRNPLSDSPRTGVQPRLWRSRDNKVLAGVVGGLAERLDVSPTGLRWFTGLATFFAGILPGVIVYLVLWGITEARSSAPRGGMS